METTVDCRRAIELLPWLVNETLEADERRAVERHLEGCETCREELEETRAAFVISSQHLPITVLLDLVEGREPELDRDLVEAHLESCEVCAEELDMVRQSHAAMAGDAADEPIGEDRADEDRNGRDDLAKVLPMRPPQEVRPPAPHWQRALMAAALVGFIAGGAEIVRLKGRVAELQSARINVAVVDLFPGELVLRGRESDAPATEVTEDSEHITLILNTRIDADGELGVEVFDAEGRVITSRTGLRRNADGLFAVSLATANLPEGVLTLNVYRDVDGERTPLESYRFEVH